MSRWSRVTALFEEALDLEPEARERLLTRAAETDPATAFEVRGLLETHTRAGGLSRDAGMGDGSGAADRGARRPTP